MVSPLSSCRVAPSGPGLEADDAMAGADLRAVAEEGLLDHTGGDLVEVAGGELLTHLDDGDAGPGLDQVLGGVHADQAGAEHHRRLRAGIAARSRVASSVRTW